MKTNIQELWGISGYDYYLRLGTYGNQDFSVDANGKKYKFSLQSKTATFVIARDENVLGTLDLMPLMLKLKKRKISPMFHLNLPQEEMVAEGRTGNVAVKMLFSEVHMRERNAKIELTSANADVLMKIRD